MLLDRASIEQVDIHDGIESTLTILGYRLKHGSITVGDLTLSSRPGSTEFVVTLPLGKAVAADGEA
ncbi:MAG: hypothetical protein QOF08_1564 [Gaiellales bacterium]|jgi:hypothetical protein|nr:hypothetical protein [Gaiellales bacterium]